ncbi:CpaD family pilus assembly lipoprotein [Bradyrhizobium sp. USDA 4353]
MSSSIVRFSPALAAASIIVAWAMSGVQAQASPRLAIDTVSRVYELPLAACSRAKGSILRFLEDMAGGRPESLRLAVVAPISSACAGIVLSAADSAGVPRDHVMLARGRSKASAAGMARITAERSFVGAVECDVLPEINYTSANDNPSDPALGCSTLNGLARMVADPEDLISGKGRVRGEGEPAASAIARQRHQLAPVPPPSDRVKTTATP